VIPAILFLLAAPAPVREGVEIELREDRDYSRVTFNQKGEEYVVACRVNYAARAAGRTVRAWVESATEPGAWYVMETDTGAAFKPRPGASGVATFRFAVPLMTDWGEGIGKKRKCARCYAEMTDGEGMLSFSDEDLWLWD
jgi:hypothetical protein